MFSSELKPPERPLSESKLAELPSCVRNDDPVIDCEDVRRIETFLESVKLGSSAEAGEQRRKVEHWLIRVLRDPVRLSESFPDLKVPIERQSATLPTLPSLQRYGILRSQAITLQNILQDQLYESTAVSLSQCIDSSREPIISNILIWSFIVLDLLVPTLSGQSLLDFLIGSLQHGKESHMDERSLRLTSQIVPVVAQQWRRDQADQDRMARGAPHVDLELERVWGFFRIADREFQADQTSKYGETPASPVVAFRQCTQALLVHSWTGHPEIRLDSIAGRTLETLGLLYRLSSSNTTRVFRTPLLYEYLDVEAACASYLAGPRDGWAHLLSYQFLFSPADQWEFFRTTNHIRLRRAYNNACVQSSSYKRVEIFLSDDDKKYLERRTKTTMSLYLVLKIRRSALLADALDQLWQREHRELLHPLRVRLGNDEGEIGIDAGGVQVEFFNLLCEEVCSPENSLLDMNPRSGLMWFRPGSLEPLYRYELLGLLFGLAIYNGITLPLSFPIAFYMKLMGRSVGYRFLRNDWPDLYDSLGKLRNYDGDVQADISAEHVYTLEANGLKVDLDMTAFDWVDAAHDKPGRSRAKVKVFNVLKDQTPVPASKELAAQSIPEKPDAPTPEPEEEHIHKRIKYFLWPGWQFSMAAENEQPVPVTNKNREAYIATYVNWILDYSIRPQFYAFAKGFYNIIDIRSLHLMTPESFRDLVEGETYVSAERLRDAATYQEYDEHSPQIQWFWSLVEEYSQAKLKRLLEFVTAYKRLPPAGAQGLKFEIKRSYDTNLLPTSHTCFGHLVIPSYQSKEALQQKLDIALEHSMGFGQA